MFAGPSATFERLLVALTDVTTSYPRFLSELEQQRMNVLNVAPASNLTLTPAQQVTELDNFLDLLDENQLTLVNILREAGPLTSRVESSSRNASPYRNNRKLRNQLHNAKRSSVPLLQAASAAISSAPATIQLVQARILLQINAVSLSSSMQNALIIRQSVNASTMAISEVEEAIQSALENAVQRLGTVRTRLNTMNRPALSPRFSDYIIQFLQPPTTPAPPTTTTIATLPPTGPG